ncbi:MAG: response regulator transcription factor, partial [Myxococcales bacterium]|nr:response regulator transcription factor [Myxococcales bacterium]
MSGRRILILEQDQKIRELLTRFLKARGYEVTGTHDADNGLRLFLAERPDVILVDLVLADGPGADLCRQVRDTHLDVALILMGTARQARRRGIENVRAELGIDSFLQKPFGIADLVTAIESALTVSAARG